MNPFENQHADLPLSEEEAISFIKRTPIAGTLVNYERLSMCCTVALKYPQIWRYGLDAVLRKKVFQLLEQLVGIDSLLSFCEDNGIRDYRVLPAPNLLENSRPELELCILSAAESFPSQQPTGWGDLKKISTHRVTTRALGMVLLPNALVLPGSSLVVLESGIAIHDNLWHSNGDDILLHDNHVLASTSETVIVENTLFYPAGIELPSAIHMVGELSHIFGHWHYDLLPRWRGYHLAGVPEDVPVLIDSTMPPTHLESLKILIGRRPIVEVQPGANVKVAALYYVNRQGWLPPQIKLNARSPLSAITVSPESLLYLRKEMLKNCSLSDFHAGLFIRRYKPTRRHMENQAHIEGLASSLNFKFSSMAELPFSSQVSLASNAKVIVGPIGSAMDHLIYAREGARVLIFTPPDFGAYANFLGAISDLPVDIRLIAGEVEASESQSKFSNFSINFEHASAGFSWLQSVEG